MNEVVPTETKSVEIYKPSTVILGTEDIGLERSDFVTPYAKLNKDTGVITNTLTGEVLPDEFIPLKFSRRYAKFKDMDLEWSTTNPTPEQAKECEFGPNGEKPTADKTINALVLFKGNDIPTVITFKRTSYNAGRTLLTMVCTGVKKAIFEKKFSLTSTLTIGKKFKYYQYVVKALGKSNEDEMLQASIIFDMFKEHETKSDVESGIGEEEIPY